MADYLMPTATEREKLARNFAWQQRLLLLLPLPMVSFAIIQLVPDMELWMTATVAALPIALMLGILVYTSFFLRCPRCNTWVSIAAPKCASCGLKSKA